MTGPREALDGLGLPADSISSLGGAHRAELADGRTVVIKPGAPGQPAVEAAGLRWLAVPNGPPVPGVLAVDEDWLVTEYVTPGRMDARCAERFGRELAALHATGTDAFGTAPTADAWIGTAPLRNVASDDWPVWYAEHRVLPYLRRASLAPDDAAAVEQVCASITDLAGPVEPPARLHGDLWSGNVHAAVDGRVWVLDPAAHGGHRETDLAMLALFGAPHLDRILAAYDEAAPLASGWRRRVPLHQLFPLLVHAVMFGGGYGASAGAAARAALR